MPAASKDPLLNLVLSTIDEKKQALVFVNSKKSAEKTAEDISKKLKESGTGMKMSGIALSAVSKPTTQCIRLSECLKKNIAFHHAGLHPEQKTLIEESFRKGDVKIICCTPTLAAGLDLPAFRAIIRDTKRFDASRGMVDIPVLEYLQMAGRAGRPKFDTYGEAILISSTDQQAEALKDKYVNGDPEDIFSKLAVEPILRTSVLSLVATRLVKNQDELNKFFEKTLWAHQFKDLTQLERILERVINMLEEWEFIDTKNGLKATDVGMRTAQLYIDPLTANKLINCIRKASEMSSTTFSWIHALCTALEMRPLLRVKMKEYDDVQEKIENKNAMLLENEPSMFEPEYEDWLNAVKTSFMLDSWVDERDEQWILENFDTRPGELKAKLDKSEWLLYSAIELARLINKKDVIKDLVRAKIRLKYGVKEELLPLVKIKQVGRIRARKLFNAGFKDIGDIRKSTEAVLAQYIGKTAASRIVKQSGDKEEPIKESRQGQTGLNSFE